MTARTQQDPATHAGDSRQAEPATAAPRGRRGLAVAALAVALAAGGTLIARGPGGGDAPKRAPGRLTAAAAWPGAPIATVDPAMPDGPLFTPVLFLDTTTAIGTAPTPSGAEVRLVLRTGDAAPRELRRVPLDGNPQFEAFTAAGDDIVWAESGDGRPVRLWAASRAGGAARMLTAGTGNAIFNGTQYDLVVADGRVHWAAAPAAGGKTTEIRSVALTGGPVAVRSEPGQWSQTAWPWLADENENRLRNTATGRDVEIATSGPDQVTCSPVWCRVMVLSGDGVARIDLMHPDGSARRRIAGGGAQAAVTDVAVLDRFEILAEPGPDTDLTGTATLLVYDLATGDTVLVAAAADGAFSRGGMLWWSTGDDDSITWHALDLRAA